MSHQLTMDRKKTLIVSLTLCIFCTLALYAYSWTVSPREISIGEIGQDDIGAFVRTQGFVKSVFGLYSGGSRIELLDPSDYSTISVFVSKEVVSAVQFMQELVPGSKIWVAGEVQEFYGNVEVMVKDEAMIGLISTATENRMDLGTLARNPDVFQGMLVVVRGDVTDIVVIIDWDKVRINSGGYSMWVEYDGKDKPIGRVDVYGKLMFNEDRDRFEIKVAGGSDAILPHPSNVPDNYSSTSIVTITEDPELWLGQLVALLDVTAMTGEVIGTTLDISEVVDGERYMVSCMIFGWDWSNDDRGIETMDTLEFTGTWDYYVARAQWQITSDSITLQLLP